MSDDVELLVAGKAHAGWKSVRLRFCIEELAPSFEVTYTDYSDDPSEPLAEINEGDDVVVKVSGSVVLTGYVERIRERENHATHTQLAMGRAKTGDVLDCTYDAKTTHFHGQTLAQIANTICAPYGIQASLAPELIAAPDYLDSLNAPIADFAIEFAEMVSGALFRLARLKSLLVMTNPDGDVIYYRPTKVPANAILRRGEQTTDWGYDGSWTDRYSEYHFTTQVPGTDSTNGAAAAHLKVSVDDTAITRTRKLALFPEQHSTLEQAKSRAKWERMTRAAASQRVYVTVEGWSWLGGLWLPNMLPRVINEKLGIDDSLLVAESELYVDMAGGQVAHLQLVGRDAYDPQVNPFIKRKKRKKKIAGFAR